MHDGPHVGVAETQDFGNLQQRVAVTVVQNYHRSLLHGQTFDQLSEPHVTLPVGRDDAMQEFRQAVAKES